MGWEYRGCHRYYYRMTRRDGKPHREYCGGGPAAQLVAIKVANDQAARRAANEAHRAGLSRYGGALEAYRSFTAWIESMNAAQMLVAGYHRCCRGPWKMRRRKFEMDGPTSSERVTFPAKQEFDQILQRANDGDQDSLADLRNLLDQHPVIWRQVADLSTHSRAAILALVGDDSCLVRESIERRLHELKESLLGDSPTTLERLAVDRIAQAWLFVDVARIKAANEGASRKSTAWSRRLDHAQREYDRSIKALADIRRYTSEGLLLTVRRAS